MHIHSDTVSEAVVEVFAVTSFFNTLRAAASTSLAVTPGLIISRQPVELLKVKW